MPYKNLPFGKTDAFNVVVENSEGASNKYEYDERLDLFKLDFVFGGDLRWPFNYGFIAGTRGGDGDMLDAIVISSHPIDPQTLVVCKTVGMVEVVDRGERDNKIICVPLADPLAKQLSDISDFSEEQQRNWEDFFHELAVQKNKIMEIKGFRNKSTALDELNKYKSFG